MAMYKRLFIELRTFLMVDVLAFVIYLTITGKHFHSTIPDLWVFQTHNAKAIAAFLFFYPYLIAVTLITLLIRAIYLKFWNNTVNFLLLLFTIISLGICLLLMYYRPGLDRMIKIYSPIYDDFILPFDIITYSFIPLLLLTIFILFKIVMFDYEAARIMKIFNIDYKEYKRCLALEIQDEENILEEYEE